MATEWDVRNHQLSPVPAVVRGWDVKKHVNDVVTELNVRNY